MKLPLLQYPDPGLRIPSEPVSEFGAELHGFLEDMAETMHAAGGIGLAAPQVGRRQRIFIIDLGSQQGYPSHRQEFINPRITASHGKAVFEEGCLSVPGITESVVRKGTVTVLFQDRFGKERELRAEGLLAVAIQHETDHLDGVLFLDRLGLFKRKWFKRKLNRVHL